VPDPPPLFLQATDRLTETGIDSFEAIETELPTGELLGDLSSFSSTIPMEIKCSLITSPISAASEGT